jgi:hypothetical protein
MTTEQLCAARRCSNVVPPKRTEGGPPKLFCAESCAKAESKARRRDRSPPPPARTGVGICARPGCENPARDPGDRGPLPIYCSRNCSDQVRQAVLTAERIARGPLIATRGCIGCGKEFAVELPSVQKFCSPPCRKETIERELRAVMALREAERRAREPVFTCCLPSCGKVFKASSSNGLRPRWYCSAEHYAEHRQLEGAAWVPPAEIADRDFRNGARRCRAAGFGAAVEVFSNLEILVRDGWKCQRCGIDTPEELRGSKAQTAPEVDHKIPINRGGAHTRENCWCLCHRCNHSKRNKLLEELPPIAAADSI